MSTRRLPFVQIIATGGTIAMRIDAESGGPIPGLCGAELVAAVPELGHMADVGVEDFANIPSEQMQPGNWLQLARRVRAWTHVHDHLLPAGHAGPKGSTTDEVPSRRPHGVVILHGTDTMEETAFFLDITVPSNIPIVFTGAMRAATDPNPDGPANMRDAALVAAHPKSHGRGVLIVMNGEIHSARRVMKVDTSEVDAFESIQPPDLGKVRSGRVHFSGAWSPRIHVPLPTHLPRVDIIPMYAGADEVALHAALAAGAGGLVITAVGAGNVNQALYQGILDTLHQGIPVVISSRVPYGGVRPIYAYSGGGVTLQKAGAIFARDLSPQKARVLLMAGLGAGIAPAALGALFA